ncbi:MAG: hypothetical protein ACLGI6_01440 [Gammaproteobacteria bacterium]
MAQAARITDPIGHSPAMSWLLKGLLVGAANVFINGSPAVRARLDFAHGRQPQ